MSEDLFSAYTNASVRRSGHRLLGVGVIGGGIAVILGACAVFVGRLLQPTPYDAMVSHLSYHMSDQAVKEWLGKPAWSGYVKDGWSWVYRAEGTKWPLILQFEGPDMPLLERWCAYIPETQKRGELSEAFVFRETGELQYEIGPHPVKLACHQLK